MLFGPPRVTAPAGGRTLNLSTKGLSIQSETVYPPGTELRLVLRPLEEGPFELMGVVAWARQSVSQMGVRLSHWDPEFPDFVHRAEATLHPRERPTIPPPPRHDVLEPEGPLSWPTGLRHPRFEEQLPVRFGLGGSLDRRGFTGNVSRTGIAVRCAESFPPGTRLQVAITLPDAEIARIDGAVMWSNVVSEGAAQAELGIRILNADALYGRLVEDWEARH